MSIVFEILFNDLFSNISTIDGLTPTSNKYALSFINDFEDRKWRYDKFQNFIWDNMADTALSHRERSNLVDQSHTKLVEAAKNLRLTDKNDDIGSGSEIAEIVLYGIMKHHYEALSVVPKIFYKQNTQDNAKGADSVHIVIDDNRFSLWIGEAKFFNSIEDARLDKIIASVENSLDTQKLKKENSIILNVSDLDSLGLSENIRMQIKETLSNRNSIDNIKPLLHIPILILHECTITKNNYELSNIYRQSIIDYHRDRATSYFKKQISRLKAIPRYKEITFHLILFPVPDKNVIVDRFINNVSFYRGKKSD